MQESYPRISQFHSEFVSTKPFNPPYNDRDHSRPSPVAIVSKDGGTNALASVRDCENSSSRNERVVLHFPRYCDTISAENRYADHRPKVRARRWIHYASEVH